MNKESIKRLEQYGKLRQQECEAKGKLCSKEYWIETRDPRPKEQLDCYPLGGDDILPLIGTVLAVAGIILFIIGAVTTSVGLIMGAVFGAAIGGGILATKWEDFTNLISGVIDGIKGKKWNKTEYPRLVAEWESRAEERDKSYEEHQFEWNSKLVRAQKKLEDLGEVDPDVEELYMAGQLDEVVRLLKRNKADTIDEAIAILEEEAEIQAEERAARREAQRIRVMEDAERRRELQERDAQRRAREQARVNCIHCDLNVGCKRKWSESSVGCAAFRPKR